LNFSPDGKLLASMGGDSSICLWEVATGRLIRRLGWRTGTINGSVVFSPDGKTLAVGNGAWSSLWRVTTGKQVHIRKPWPDGALNFIVFSPDGTKIAIGRWFDKIYLRELATDKDIRQFGGDKNQYWALLYSPDGKNIIAGSVKSTIHTVWIWDADTGKLRRTIQTPDDYFHSAHLAISPDGKILATGGRALRLWDVSTGREIRQFGPRRPSYHFTFSPDGKMLATWWNNPIFYETVTGGNRGGVNEATGYNPAFAFSPDGKLAATGTGSGIVLVTEVFRPLEFSSGARQNLRQPRSRKLTLKMLDKLWNDLADETPSRAFQALCRLMDAPGQAVPFLASHFRPVARATPPKFLAKLIDDLDSRRYATRQKAGKELEKLGAFAVPDLRRALGGQPSLEVRRRIEKLLEKLTRCDLSPETLRGLRAIEGLEHIGSPEAKKVLKAIVKGSPSTSLRAEANAALRRLVRQDKEHH